MKYFLLSAFLILTTTVLYSQYRTEFSGSAAAGNILVGHGNNIKSVLFGTKNIAPDKEGYFIIGFDRDAAGKYRVVVTYKDKKKEKFTYVIDKEKYDVQRINGLSKSVVTPPRKEKARIARETKIISAQKKKIVNTKISYYRNGFALPVDSSNISGVFGSGRVLNGKKRNPHNGVDFSVPEGYPVKAAGDGIVILAEENFFFNGTFIMIDHGYGLVTNYLHLSKLHIKRGDMVKKGDLIGEVGSTGRSSGAHLHWGVTLFNNRINPMCLIDLKFNDIKTE